MRRTVITVIIPVFNIAEYLPAALESVISSTHKNLEIILVDDGSTDGSGDICEQYASLDGRISVIHKENGGVSSARNAGLEAASGEWISFVDGDDRIEPDMYSYLLDMAEKYSADAVQCGVICESAKGGETVCSPRRNILLDTDKPNFRKRFIRYFGYACWSKLYRRTSLSGVRFEERFFIGEDFRFNLDVLAGGARTVLCGRPMYHYLQRETGAIRSTASGSRLTAFREMLSDSEKAYTGMPLFKKIILDARLLDGADICSKLMLSGEGDGGELFCEIGSEVRKNAAHLLFSSKISTREKLKLLLIGFAPRTYKKLLKKKKAPDTVKEET